MTWPDDFINKIIQGDCLEAMKKMSDNSIDLIITDPPYGISFMNKDWDRALPSVDVWRECLRVLKPGAWAFVMCIPRQDCLSRQMVNLEDAGFDISFSSIYWAFATGFPKNLNISKAIDKKYGCERKIVGIRPDATKLNKSIQDAPGGWHTAKREKNITSSTSSQAKQFDGWHSMGLKPAVEVVIVCQKPISEKSYTDQALKFLEDDSVGPGCVNVNGCRIPYEDEKDIGTTRAKCTFTEKSKSIGFGTEKTNYGTGSTPLEQANECVKPQGRFPANLLVSDDVLNDGKISGSGQTKFLTPKEGKEYAKPFKDSRGWNQHSMERHATSAPDVIGDSGSFSRYFDLDRWFGEQIKKLPEEVQKVLPFLIVPKASRSEKDAGCEDMPERDPLYGKNFSSSDKGTISQSKNPITNYHPTVKPVGLMSYLITLGSREGQVVLDPFAGSGTTGVGAVLIGRKYVLIEIDEEYCEIIRKRIRVVELPLFPTPNKNKM